MNRVYTQLTQKDYTKDQLEEIQAGLAQGLDVSIYARIEFLAIQMHEIRLGLEKGLPVKKYASLQFDWFQMREIRLGLEAGLDVTSYASPRVGYETMKQLRLGLSEGVDLSAYKALDPGVLKQLRLALHDKINIVNYIVEGYDAEQLEEIREALHNGVQINGYVRKDLRGIALREVFWGLKEGLDVSVYSDSAFNWQQMRELRLGLEHMLDVSVYRNAYYTHEQMRELRLGLENGLDVSYYSSLMYTAKDMRERRLALEQDPAVWVQTQLASIDELIEQAGVPTRLGESEHCRVTVSADEMQAYIDVLGSRDEISKIEIVKELNRHGVIYGIKYDVINEIVRGNASRKAVLIAEGDPMIAGEDGWYEYFFRTSVARTPKCLDDGSIDYRDVEWFETVQKGQKLAVYHEATSGQNGMTITGRSLIARRGKEQGILTGSGFTRQKDGLTYISDLQGIVTLCGSLLQVTELLIVQDVNMATGDVSYAGNVLVEGNVSSGAKISATGDIVVMGFVESAEIKTAGNVFLRKGMNAGGAGFVHAAKDVIGYFFEGAEVYAGGNVQGDYFLNSHVHAEGTVQAIGKKGSFAGGSVCAECGLRAQSMGNKSGLKTYMKLGMAERIERKEREINDKITAVDQELRALQDASGNFQKKYAPEIRNTMEIYLKIESAIYTKERQMEQLFTQKKELLELQKKDAENVQAVIEGYLYDGVTVDIDGIKWNAKSVKGITVKRVRKRIALFANHQISGTVRPELVD